MIKSWCEKSKFYVQLGAILLGTNTVNNNNNKTPTKNSTPYHVVNSDNRDLMLQATSLQHIRMN